jgi:hypothetical protein
MAPSGVLFSCCLMSDSPVAGAWFGLTLSGQASFEDEAALLKTVAYMKPSVWRLLCRALAGSFHPQPVFASVASATKHGVSAEVAIVVHRRQGYIVWSHLEPLSLSLQVCACPSSSDLTLERRRLRSPSAGELPSRAD